MDCSWLHEDVEEDDPVPESDSDNEQIELEERLNGIIHHSAKEELLAPEIAKHFSVQCVEDGGIIVQLKKSLDEIKSEEKKCDFSQSQNGIYFGNSINSDLPNIDNNNDNDEVVVMSESCNYEERQQSKKRFRYSDVNIDHNEMDRDLGHDSSFKSIDYFSVGPIFFKKPINFKFKHLTIPKSLNTSDWKTSANDSFISIQNYNNLNELEIVDKMVEELKRENPHEKRAVLQAFAKRLYGTNTKIFRRRQKRKLKRSLQTNLTNETILLDTPNNQTNKRQNAAIQGDLVKCDIPCGSKMNGSILSNPSPFIPCTSTPYKDTDSTPFIDLTRETSSISYSQANNSGSTNCSEKIGIPRKWSRKMIRYYTRPSKKKLDADISVILNNLKKTSVAADWWLDPLDKTGLYANNAYKRRLSGGRRCINCKEFGHFIRDCPKPKKIMTCTLCGDYYHMDNACPNIICRKCGIPTPNNDERLLGLCHVCYHSDFDDDLVCKVCGQYTHYSEICTDLWRKYHATTEMDSALIIPEVTNENPRKFCSNCSRKGHFSHQCSEAGDKSCPMITNYSDKPLDLGSTNYSFLPDDYDIVNSNQFDNFLQNLATTTSTYITFVNSNVDCVLKIHGTFEKCRNATSEIQSYVNTKKRKRNEPTFSRKKRRI